MLTLTLLANTPMPPAVPAEFPTKLLLVCVAFFVLGLAGSALFSGIETATYTLSRLRLFLRESVDDPRARILRHETENMPRLISTLLIGNNISNYILSFAVTVILSQIFELSEFASIALQALILTPFLFIFVETLPKELFRTRADRIIYPLAPLLRFIRITFTAVGLLPLVSITNKLILRFANSADNEQFVSARARMSTQLHEGVGQGLISTYQINIVERSLKARNLPVRQIMTPWEQTAQLDRRHATRKEIQKQHQQLHHSRYPVIDSSSGSILGVITLLDALLTTESANESTGILNSVSPATYLKTTDTVPDALNQLRQSGAWLAIVGSPEEPLGIVTRKDLLDPLLGTIAAA